VQEKVGCVDRTKKTKIEVTDEKESRRYGKGVNVSCLEEAKIGFRGYPFSFCESPFGFFEKSGGLERR
jgi:hypothetical protein